MPDAKVYANTRSILHAGDGLSQASATPNVCKTPTPNGPTPMPYANVAQDRDLAKGTTRTKIAGKSVAIVGANLRTSTGDEAGTAGGGVVSGKIKGKVTWLGGSPNVRFEGKQVIRFGDTALHNGNSSNAGGQPNSGKMSPPGSEDCAHVNLKRVPEAESFRYHDEERPGDGALRAIEKGMEKKRRKVERAQRDHDAALAAGAGPQIMKDHQLRVQGYADDLAGTEWEYLVGHDVDAEEMSVEIWCTDCKKRLTELDVIMGDGVVKECKVSWDAIKPRQVALQIELLETRQVLGPARTVHLAIPKGERGRLDKKFERSTLTKDDMRGRIQEH